MKKIVKLTESDLQRIVNRVIRESMISELGGMDDGHPFSGEMNFNDLPLKDRERVNKYYRLDDVEVDNSYSELDSELEDDFEEDEYPKPKRMFNRNSERPFRPRTFNRD
jgi:hypothetical protein